jgi:nucleotidyltransferase/DNA polymerase involved in DNA repair
MTLRTILHIDMDAFFTSIEQRDNALYRGKPVIVGAKPGHRGVVAAASYEARKFGVHSAMPISEAYKKCPAGVFLLPRMDIYINESRQIMDILSSFSPLVEQVSVDEAFLDITGTEKLFGVPYKTAQKISRTIKEQRKLTASIGIAPNKFLAKVASDMNKPDGITQVPFTQDEITQWLGPKPVGKIWGVGKKTEEILHGMHINTIGELQKLNKEFLINRLGVYGETLHDLAFGMDTRPVEDREDSKSISREHTFEINTCDRDLIHKVLLVLSQDVARQARKALIKGKTIVLIYRGTNFTKHTRRITLSEPTNTANDIYSTVLKLIVNLPEKMEFRLIGAGISGFEETVQLDLFTTDTPTKSWAKSEKAIDNLEQKYGKNVVVRARELK